MSIEHFRGRGGGMAWRNFYVLYPEDIIGEKQTYK
jgi:hypothetical protein